MGSLLLDSLLDIRIGEAVFGMIIVEAPWAFRIRPGNYATLYAMIAGSATLAFDPATSRALEQGSVVSIVSGREHTLSHADGDVSRATELFDQLGPVEPDPTPRAGCDTIVAARVPIGSNPLPDVLAETIYVPPAQRAVAGRLDAVLRMAGQYHGAPASIREPVSRRIAEILAIELTEFSLNESGSGLASRINDPRIRRTVALLRVHPERPWTLVRLAEEACMSRSAFAARFREVVGRPPMAYLQSLRMERASELVRDTSIPLYEIVNRVGYASDTAFSKAFQREFAQSPVRYRKAAIAS